MARTTSTRVRKLAGVAPRAVRAGQGSGKAAASGGSRSRHGEVERTTKETSVRVGIAIDGAGRAEVATGVPFLDHMLDLFAKHGLFDLTVQATGDLHIDQHHTVEDVGLTLGQAIRDALGDKHGIRRFGQQTVPLDESLVSVVVDLSGRPYLVYELEPGRERVGDFDTSLVHDFLLAFVNELKLNLHVDCIRGRNPHHMIEAMFKGLGRALDQATQLDPRISGVMSTKGVL
jgi:imidazoleglycerol-phosphate dehydratase